MDFRKSLKLVIFDFDGTLFHLNADWQALGEALGTNGTNETMGDALQRHRDEGNHNRLAAANAVEIEAVGTRRVSPEIIQCLQKLAAMYKVAIFTRNSHETVERALQGTAMEGKLYIVGREDAAHLKPHTEGLEILCRHFSVIPTQAVLVGDTEHDVIVAHAFGLPAIIVANPSVPRQPADADDYIKTIPDLLHLLAK
ncbi:MAG TPA: HAD-IA family hydrolase [Patescibacteria group bacterium]|nr:HAD-IA family hydrolase [Patescibacteria group bacterium]